MKIDVTPEGRDEVWLPDRESLKRWIVAQEFDAIHNFMTTGPVLLGADHEVDSVLASIDAADRLALLTGDARRQNMNHALAVITTDERLELYDLGDLTEDDLEL